MTDNVTATSGAGAGSSDPVNHPTHYADGWSNGAEVIDISENLNFNRGNAVKYIARAGKKDPAKELEDLQKAKFYLEREINRWDNPPTYVVVPDGFPWVITEPRVWDSLNDVPVGIEVTDADGDEWFGDGNTEDDVWTDKYAPFTEVLS